MAIAILFATPLITLATPTPYIVTINGKAVEFDDDIGQPYTNTKTSRIMIPIRVVSENMGYKVEWTKERPDYVKISNGEETVELTIGESSALVNGKKVYIDLDENNNPKDTKSELRNNRTYVPVRFVSEALGATVGYERTVQKEVVVHKVIISTINNWIEPEFDVLQTYDRRSQPFFIIFVDNYKDYKGTDVTFSSVQTSHPQFYEYKTTDIFVKDGWRIFTKEKTMKEWADIDESDINHYSRIYQFTWDKGNLDVNTNKQTPLPKTGEIIKVETIVKMNGKSKTYYHDVPFLADTEKLQKEWAEFYDRVLKKKLE